MDGIRKFCMTLCPWKSLSCAVSGQEKIDPTLLPMWDKCCYIRDKVYVIRVRARIFFSFATTFANLIFLVPISLNLGHLSPLCRKSY